VKADPVLDDEAVCECGHMLYLHDDGVGACVASPAGVDCECRAFKAYE